VILFDYIADERVGSSRLISEIKNADPRLNADARVAGMHGHAV